MKIALYGGTGMIGSRIAAEAASRDHVVTAITRTAGPTPDGVISRRGDAGDEDDVARVAAENDVVVSAISPSRTGGRHEVYLAAIRSLAENVGTRRLVVVGGSGSLQAAPGLRMMDLPNFPKASLPEARTQVAALELLKDVSNLVNWVYVSPPSSIAPATRTGEYQEGLEIPVGEFISAEDFAVAIVDELEVPHFRRIRIHIAY